MKIGILIAGLVPYGAERAAIRLAQGMKERGIDVSILVTDAPSPIKVKNVPVIPQLIRFNVERISEIVHRSFGYAKNPVCPVQE